MHDIAGQTLEFEVMVNRAVRQGRLDIAALSDSYAQLSPSAHRELNNPRKVDVEGVVAALEILPPEIVKSERLVLVPRLETFIHQPVAHRGKVSAGLMDGTLLVEAPLGNVSLFNSAAALCLLFLEINKADSLLPTELRTVSAQDSDDSPSPIPEPKAGTGPLSSSSNVTAPGTSAAASETKVAPQISSPFSDLVADEASSQTDRVSDASDPGSSDESSTPVQDVGEKAILTTAFSRLAFAWGTDVETLKSANARTQGAFLQLLLGLVPLPEVGIHPDLEPRVIARQKRTIAEQAVAILAEMGLVNRPLHLWIGSWVISECLSPYPRELRETLSQWARLCPEHLGHDLQEPPQSAGEDVVYAITHDFLRANPQLEEERKQADRTVGLLRQRVGDFPCEVIDLLRIDPKVCDARLGGWRTCSGSPVLLRLPFEPGDPDAGLLRGLCAAVGAHIASVTMVLEGSILGGSPGAVLLPDLMVRWAGEQKLWLPTSVSLGVQDVQGLTELSVSRGTVLSVPGTALVSASQLDHLQRQFNLGAVEVGGAALLQACTDALWGNLLPAEATIDWAVVDVERLATGRPSVRSLAGLSAVAIAKLRELLAISQTQDPEPPPPAATDPRLPPGPSPRAIRLKA